jgi:hypothetical protein
LSVFPLGIRLAGRGVGVYAREVVRRVMGSGDERGSTGRRWRGGGGKCRTQRSGPTAHGGEGRAKGWTVWGERREKREKGGKA